MAAVDAKPTKERLTKSQKQTKWYPFFKDSDNVYINDLALRAKRSPTHGAILQSKAVYTAGEEFTFFVNDKPTPFENLDQRLKNWLKQVNGDRDSLHWIFSKEAYDYIYSGNAYVEVQRGKEFTSVFYQDATKVRVSDDTAYISAYWRDIKNQVSGSKEYPIEEIELWNGKLDTKQKKFLIHIKNDTPEYDYYGLPESVQALTWADVEYKIPQFNLDEFKNGFFPSAMLNIVGKPPEGYSDEAYIKAIIDKFTGEGNNSKLVAQLVDDPTQAAQITEFSRVKEGQFKELQELATQNIISAHRWFASLAGVQTAGSLGSNQQIRNEYNIALKGVVIPQFQKPLLKVFNELLQIAGFTNVELGIMNVAPVGFEDRIEPKEVLTRDEQREALGYEPDGLEETKKDEPDNGDNDSK